MYRRQTPTSPPAASRINASRRSHRTTMTWTNASSAARRNSGGPLSMSPLHRDEPSRKPEPTLGWAATTTSAAKNLSTCAWPRTPAENLRTRRRHEAPGPPTARTNTACHLDAIGKR